MSSRPRVLPIAVTLGALAALGLGALGLFQAPVARNDLTAAPPPSGTTAAVATATAPTPASSAGATSPSASPGPSAPPASAVPASSASPSATAARSAPASPSVPATPVPSASPKPASSLVPAPLTGLPVAPNVARRHVIAVMIDDLSPARPQSGFTAADVVWQAPAEGGIPRYMLLFQAGVPGDVGPVRSARYYFIGWAAEWRAAYAHAGGSPQALRTLRTQGRGQLVYNVDEFAWSSYYFWRIHTRSAPHNLYTSGARLRLMANRVGAAGAKAAQPPAWTFGSEAPYEDRPTGGSIEADYFANHIRYTYDRATNTYPRWVSPGVRQVDASTGGRVAPKNVVIMFVRFGPLNDSHPEKGRLEAEFVGSGRAFVATNGRTISARWVKTSLTGPTRFLDAKGRPFAFTPGQTFVQVMPAGSRVTLTPGREPPKPAPVRVGSRPR